MCVKPKQLLFHWRCMVKISERTVGKISSLIYLEPPCCPSLDFSFTLLGAGRFDGSQAPGAEGCSHHSRHCNPPVPHRCRFFFMV